MPELVIYWFNGNRKPLAKIPLPLQTTHPPKKNPGYGPATLYYTTLYYTILHFTTLYTIENSWKSFRTLNYFFFLNWVSDAKSIDYPDLPWLPWFSIWRLPGGRIDGWASFGTPRNCTSCLVHLLAERKRPRWAELGGRMTVTAFSKTLIILLNYFQISISRTKLCLPCTIFQNLYCSTSWKLILALTLRCAEIGHYVSILLRQTAEQKSYILRYLFLKIVS